MLSYFQLLYDYFSLIQIISPYIICGYYKKKLFFLLFQPRLFFIILNYFWLFLFISP
jgi:hypothetical protein